MRSAPAKRHARSSRPGLNTSGIRRWWRLYGDADGDGGAAGACRRLVEAASEGNDAAGDAGGCACSSSWGKAQSYLEASLSIEETREAHLALAALADELGRTDAANAHYRTAARLSLCRPDPHWVANYTQSCGFGNFRTARPGRAFRLLSAPFHHRRQRHQDRLVRPPDCRPNSVRAIPDQVEPHSDW